MTNLIVIAGILIVIMTAFIFILFKNIIKRMDENAKKYFVNKMQDYDYILEERQEKLDEIKQELEEAEAEYRNILRKDDDNIDLTKQKEEEKKTTLEDEEVVLEKQKEEVRYNLNIPEYRETQFFNNYKEVRNIFTVNNEKIINDFIAEHKNVKEEKEYKALGKIKNKFDKDSIYGCLTLSSEEQIEIMNEALTETEKKLVGFQKLSKNENFTLEDLITFIDNRMEQIEPTIYIYTNVLDNRYDDIDKNIVTKKYNNMSEGIIIKYRNKIYDYSI